MKPRSQSYEEGRRLFKELSADGSAIRAFSEARRENGAGDYDPVSAADAFDRGLPHAIKRVGAIAERLTHMKPKR
ncbi:hypothetical protein OHD62_33315 [Mesorhizobium sp. YC-39]|uniref:hypothetical protein n=1 Tax=unclassified Mesorhizobium TaxID=325217 RepID=UPI0021E7D633|nr:MULTISPECIES: hypothetical protein [unclassified Mesorhizobium]MCV3211553.1 hypothetical protein [Mesorhizobium sp. YC-2]MCV3233249.1 hypothetical protein [Mesorhizobium sp. YC-39]